MQRDLGKRPLQVPHQLERTLRVARVLHRVKPRVAGQCVKCNGASQVKAWFAKAY